MEGDLAVGRGHAEEGVEHFGPLRLGELFSEHAGKSLDIRRAEADCVQVQHFADRGDAPLRQSMDAPEFISQMSAFGVADGSIRVSNCREQARNGSDDFDACRVRALHLLSNRSPQDYVRVDAHGAHANHLCRAAQVTVFMDRGLNFA